MSIYPAERTHQPFSRRWTVLSSLSSVVARVVGVRGVALGWSSFPIEPRRLKEE